MDGEKVESGSWSGENQLEPVRSGILKKQLNAVAIYNLFIFRKGGLTYLGQDQDSLGGDFNARQSWSGMISQFNVWNWALEDYFIENAAECRSDLLGNVMDWVEGKWFIGKVNHIL